MTRRPSNLPTVRAAWRITADIAPRETPCYRIVNAGRSRARVMVYDVIGGWDLDAASFVDQVHALDVDAIDLHVNSPGGFVWDAVAMYEALDQHKAAVDVHIDGLAASAASFLAMVGDTVTIARGGRMMIHDAQGVGVGSPADMREYADLLDAVSDDISGYYAARAGGKSATWRAAMTATTWYSADQAVDAKLADRVSGGTSNTGPDNRSRLIMARHRVLTAQGG